MSTMSDIPGTEKKLDFSREDAIRKGFVVDVSEFAKKKNIKIPTAISAMAMDKIKQTSFEDIKLIDMLAWRINAVLHFWKEFFKKDKMPVQHFHVPLYRLSDTPLLEKFVGVLHQENGVNLLTIVLPHEVEYHDPNLN